MCGGGNPLPPATRHPLPSLFRSQSGFAFFSPFFFPAESVKSFGMAAKRLRKSLAEGICAKDAEKARKICGITCGFPASKRWISGGKAGEMLSMYYGTKSL